MTQPLPIDIQLHLDWIFHRTTARSLDRGTARPWRGTLRVGGGGRWVPLGSRVHSSRGAGQVAHWISLVQKFARWLVQQFRQAVD